MIRTAVRNITAEQISRFYFPGQLDAGPCCVVEAQDTGCGMTKETLARCCDPFFSTKFTGRGMGLAAVLGIVRSHGGAIDIDTRVGKGTKFSIFLPQAALTPPESPTPSGTTPTRRQPKMRELPEEARGKCVLLVDDEPSVRLVTRRQLERLGLRVITATNGVEGIEALREHKDEVSCVILDQLMPEMAGDEALPLMRQIRPDIPVIVASGFSEDGIEFCFRQSRVQGYLRKPFQVDDLVDALTPIFRRPVSPSIEKS